MSWPMTQLGEVTKIISGSTPKTGKDEFWDGDIPWVTPKDLSSLNSKSISNGTRNITRQGMDSCSTTLLPEGSVLFSSRAPIGLVAINEIPMCTNQGFKSFVPEKDKVFPDYLYWWLKAHRRQLEQLGRGATFKEVSKKVIAEVSFPLPPLEEQKRIAKILDAADALRAKRRESLAQLDALLQSTFLDLFGDLFKNPNSWEMMNFEEIAEGSFRNGLSPSSSGRVRGKVLTLSAITSGVFDSSFSKDVFFDREPSPEQHVGEEVFMICRGNGNKAMVGVGVFGSDMAEACVFPDTMIAVNPVFGLVKKGYLQMVWRSEFVRQQIERGARTTNGTFKINQELLKSVSVPVPPISLQEKYDALVGKAYALRANSFRHLMDLDNLFISLQARAFSGEL